MNKNWIDKPWTIGLGTSLFGVLITTLFDFFKNKPTLTTLNQIFRWLYELITKILNFQLSLWLVGLIVGVVWFYFGLRNRRKGSIQPPFWNYRRDKFKTLTWKWDYENHNGN